MWMLFSKTVWSAAGLVGLAVYQASTDQWPAAVQSCLAALAALGLRQAVERQAAPAAAPPRGGPPLP
jgi:hypothetical protein